MAETNHTPSQLPLVTLPRYEFVGPIQDVPTMLAASDYIDNWHNEWWPQDRPKTPEELEQLSQMRAALFDFTLDLGVDASDRLARNDKVHYYDGDTWEQICLAAKRPANWMGVSDSSDEIMINAGVSEADKLNTTNHEMIHLLTHRPVRIQQAENDADAIRVDIRSRRGYSVSKTGAFDGFDEWLVEYMNDFVRNNYWKNYPALRDHVESDAGYNRDVGKDLVDGVAQEIGRAPEDILRDLMRGALTGNMKALKPFHEAGGKEGLRSLARLSLHGSVDTSSSSDQK
jgi:hypothetical protein